MKPTVNRLICKMNSMKQRDGGPNTALIMRISDLQESLTALSKETADRDLSVVLLNPLRDGYAMSAESCIAAFLSTHADKTSNERLKYVVSVPLARQEMLLSAADNSTTLAQSAQTERQPGQCQNNQNERARREYYQ